MLLRRLAKWIVGRTVGPFLERKFREWKAPRMLGGYRNHNAVFCPRTRISDTVYFYYPERIDIADKVFVWHYTILDGTGGLTIEEGCQIGAWVGIFTHSSHVAIRLYGNRYQEVDDKRGFVVAPVRIGKYTFVGAAAKILAGVTLGMGCVVTPGSVVAHSFPDFSVLAGNPAKRVGDSRDMDREHLTDPQLREWYQEWAGLLP